MAMIELNISRENNVESDENILNQLIGCEIIYVDYKKEGSLVFKSSESEKNIPLNNNDMTKLFHTIAGQLLDRVTCHSYFTLLNIPVEIFSVVTPLVNRNFSVVLSLKNKEKLCQQYVQYQKDKIGIICPVESKVLPINRF